MCTYMSVMMCWFYSLKEPESPVRAMFPLFGSKFRYSGRTQYQSRSDPKDGSRPTVRVDRSASSRRFAPTRPIDTSGELWVSVFCKYFWVFHLADDLHVSEIYKMHHAMRCWPVQTLYKRFLLAFKRLLFRHDLPGLMLSSSCLKLLSSGKLAIMLALK